MGAEEYPKGLGGPGARPYPFKVAVFVVLVNKLVIANIESQDNEIFTLKFYLF